jgi:hypothetical protein
MPSARKNARARAKVWNPRNFGKGKQVSEAEEKEQAKNI